MVTSVIACLRQRSGFMHRQRDNVVMQIPMTEVIAVRHFWWEGEPERLSVSIGKPAQLPDSKGEFYCPIQTSGFGNDERVEGIFGVDAFQAIELAMRYVGHRLSDIDAKNGGRLRWEFGDNERLPPEWALQNRSPQK